MSLNIKAAIKEHGLTSKEVAERMEITTVALSQHINGNPSLKVLEKIAKAIGCDISELFEQAKPQFTCPHCGMPINIELFKSDEAK